MKNIKFSDSDPANHFEKRILKRHIYEDIHTGVICKSEH